VFTLYRDSTDAFLPASLQHPRQRPARDGLSDSSLPIATVLIRPPVVFGQNCWSSWSKQDIQVQVRHLTLDIACDQSLVSGKSISRSDPVYGQLGSALPQHKPSHLTFARAQQFRQLGALLDFATTRYTRSNTKVREFRLAQLS